MIRWDCFRGRVAATVITCAGVLAAAAPSAGAASTRSRLSAALAAGRHAGGAPEATATVIRRGRVVWSGADGLTSLRSGRPARITDRFVIASSTKPVTAALVLQLVQQGKLSLDEKLSRFYPQLPAANVITVRMLLNHTSGLNEYFDDPVIASTIERDPRHAWTRNEVLRGVTKTIFAPGTRSSYSNSAFVVLGGIVEALSGGTIERDFQQAIAGPLGLSRSTFTYAPEQTSLFAHPYLRIKGKLTDALVPGLGIPADYWGPVWTDGGLASTSPDLARFTDALFRDRVLPRTLMAEMTHANRFGTRLGLDSLRYGKRVWLGHSGRYGGYESEMWHDGARGLTIVVNSNSEHSSLRIWKALASAYGRNASPTRLVLPVRAV